MLEKNRHIIVFVFFSAYLFIGIGIFRDYGLSWDEYYRREAAQNLIEQTVFGEQVAHVPTGAKYHGIIFEMLLMGVERGFGLEDLRDIFLMRHSVTFLTFFLGVVFFYLLCRHRFRDWKIGLLGALFLILSPRIFAHSFYNPKDIPCLAFFIVSIYTLVRYLEKKTVRRALIHALATALVIDVRVVGAIIPVFTLIFLACDWLATEGKDKWAKSALIYFLATPVFTVLFWPVLWRNPAGEYLTAFKQMSHYPWPFTLLYMGKYLKASEIPWHYAPVWIAMSTPLMYLILFLIGAVSRLFSCVKNVGNFYRTNKIDLIALSWFFIPLVIIIGRGSALYDGWRHVFFVYPGLLLVALAGLTTFVDWARKFFPSTRLKAANIALALLVALGLSDPLYFTFKYHPHQNVYVNPVAGSNMQDIKENFELDYWGLSYRKVLEHILKSDSSPTIEIQVANDAGKWNQYLLSPGDRKRIVYVSKTSEAKYLVSNYRWHPSEYKGLGAPYYSINIGNARLAVVYQRR
jgi:hypothetical protein